MKNIEQSEQSELRVGLIVTIAGVLLTAILAAFGWWATSLTTVVFDDHSTISSMATKQDYMLNLLAGKDIIPQGQQVSISNQ